MELEKQCPHCGTAFIINPDRLEQPKATRKTKTDKIIRLVPRRELTIDDVQGADGTFTAGGWILDYPLPKQLSIELLAAAHAAIMEYLGFYSLELPLYSIFDNLFADPDDPETRFECKEKTIADVRTCIEQSIVKLWEICMLILDVKEETAIAGMIHNQWRTICRFDTDKNEGLHHLYQ